MARVMVAALLVGVILYINFRYVVVHFSNGGDLLDSGWFAWILASGDAWLTNPRSVSNLSYFNYHLSPYMAALSLIFHTLGIDGFTALALHQGAMFALLAGSLYGLVLTTWAGRHSAVLFAAAATLTLLGDVVLQIASYPHFEIAIAAFCALGTAFWQSGQRRLGGLAFALACLVREDGGLYAAAFLLGLAALPPWSRRTATSLEVRLAAGAVLVSAAMFAIKARFFPGFAAFSVNFSGHGWDHVTADFVGQRLANFAADPHALTTLLAALVLAVASLRYLVFPLLMSPLIALQLIALRDQLGHFTRYYALPFLVIWAGMLLVGADRARRGKLRPFEPVVLLGLAILGSGPVLLLVRPPGWLPVVTTALATPVTNLSQLAAEAKAAVAGLKDVCVSTGVASLIPGDLAPAQVITPTSDLSPCRTIFLFSGDLHYEALRPRVAGFTAGPVIEGRIERYDRKP